MILDGKKVAMQIRAEIKETISKIKGKRPGLTVVLVGENPASAIYVRAKQKACIEAGMISDRIQLPAKISQADLLKIIHELNQNSAVHGILVQLPLPSHIDPTLVTLAIDPNKDVDGFHPLNMGKLLLGEESFVPCTPLGIKTLLEAYHIPVKGKHVVVLGRSNIVGKPLAALLVQKSAGCNATVTLAHSQSENLTKITQEADILVAAIGASNFVTGKMIKEKAVVIDVGINRVQDALVGDVHFESVREKASAVTPVPGGVGPMTIAMLLKNTLAAFSKLLVFLFLLASCQKKEAKDLTVTFEGEALKSPYHITVGNALSSTEIETVEALIQRSFEAYGALFDVENPDSEISKLNQAPKETLIPLSCPMQEVLELSEKIVRMSSHRFDPTIQPILQAWQNSDDPDLQVALEATGWDHIAVQNGIFKKSMDETQLNLGGIAKGRCVDEIAERLLELGYQNFLIQWAGNIRANGHHPNASDWVVRINPALTMNQESMAPIPLRDASLATSGTHFYRIIDPSTAYPIQKTDFSIAFVTVIAPSAALADALSTASMLFQTRKEAESWAQEVVECYPDVRFWILSYRMDDC